MGDRSSSVNSPPSRVNTPSVSPRASQSIVPNPGVAEDDEDSFDDFFDSAPSASETAVASNADSVFAWAQHGGVAGNHNFSFKGKPVTTDYLGLNRSVGVDANRGHLETGYSMGQIAKVGMLRELIEEYKKSDAAKKLSPEKLQEKLLKMVKNSGYTYSANPDEEPTAEKMLVFLQSKSAKYTLDGLSRRALIAKDFFEAKLRRQVDDMAWMLKWIASTAKLAQSANVANS